ncbi:hypothetical protein AC629_01085 [Bradyrhizobium sp. NAS80.1]|nr:hypothetical protein AC629_01085 [Bradyrhizobium sp. NAS80.1]
MVGLFPQRSAAQPAAQEAESRAAFAVVATVIGSPRCQGCHTQSEFPRQGDDQHRHLFNVMRGPDDGGALGLPCTTCHGQANNAASGVPGADEAWRLAPISMGWEGLTTADICRHLKDPVHNGRRIGEQVVDHLRTGLVKWAWSPGTDAHGRARTTPSVPYFDFIAAAEMWVQTGEACP